MLDLREYLDHQSASVFKPSELNEIILTGYNILGWALRDGCDTLRFTAHSATWLRGRLPVGQFQESPRQTLTFRAALERILERDAVVRRYLRRVAETPDEVTYQIVKSDEQLTGSVSVASGTVVRG